MKPNKTRWVILEEWPEFHYDYDHKLPLKIETDLEDLRRQIFRIYDTYRDYQEFRFRIKKRQLTYSQQWHYILEGKK
jgi:hypothetical protein